MTWISLHHHRYKFLWIFFICLTLPFQILSGQKNSTAEKYMVKADEFKNNAKPDSAVFYYKKAAAIFKENKKTKKLINAYNLTGSMLARQDKFEEGRMYLGMAELQGNTLKDTNDLLRAATFIGLGVIYSSVGDFGGALAYHYRALAIRLLKSGKYNADVATSYGNIGNVYLIKKEYDKSIEAHLTALDIRNKIFGEKSVEINQTYNNLGKVYKEKKEFETSLLYFQKLLENKTAQVGSDSKDLVKVYNSISEVYYLMGQKELGDENKAKGDEILNK
ncbi:MAG: tetratricopeptide repeat protein [Saprospiraceae bacterium]|uniref:Tetratricopeptide repeat protein n=1 Tax=Candidatus Opimibacter skivensis TaxID=2982028 RepID=A0A9D7SWN9_9BACT|nr:tetratricopeptide repeat protein [Candidatus Opimibacter skivensis]